MNNLPLGRLGEEIATQFLQKQGYKILDRNYHQRWGEVDIFALDKDVLVAVEVKTRMINDPFTPEASITSKKKRLLQKEILLYKSKNSSLPSLLRIDFVGIVLKEDLTLERINLIKNISF